MSMMMMHRKLRPGGKAQPSAPACSARRVAGIGASIDVDSRRLRVKARASSTEAGEEERRLPIIFAESALLPTQECYLHVKAGRDPAYDKFKQLTRSNSKGLIGHVLHKMNAPQPIAEKAPLGGAGIAFGCAAKIQNIKDVNGDEILVSYQGVRRFEVQEYHDDSELPDATCKWVDDTDIDEVLKQAPFGTDGQEYIGYVSMLERKLWNTILEIGKLEKKLGRQNYSIPEQIRQVAPPSMKKKYPNRAVSDMQVWLGHSPVQTDWTPSFNPYQAIAEEKHKFTRQELFSFAAVNLVAETIEEKCVLLENTSTRAKLEWAEAFTSPYLERLQTEYSMYGVMEGMEGNAEGAAAQ